jgi:hypothetical protein
MELDKHRIYTTAQVNWLRHELGIPEEPEESDDINDGGHTNDRHQ